MKSQFYGTATLTTRGETFDAEWNTVAGMMHLHIANHQTVVGVLLAGSTNQGSAEYLLKRFAESRDTIGESG